MSYPEDSSSGLLRNTGNYPPGCPPYINAGNHTVCPPLAFFTFRSPCGVKFCVRLSPKAVRCWPARHSVLNRRGNGTSRVGNRTLPGQAGSHLPTERDWVVVGRHTKGRGFGLEPKWVTGTGGVRPVVFDPFVSDLVAFSCWIFQWVPDRVRRWFCAIQ